MGQGWAGRHPAIYCKVGEKEEVAAIRPAYNYKYIYICTYMYRGNLAGVRPTDE